MRGTLGRLLLLLARGAGLVVALSAAWLVASPAGANARTMPIGSLVSSRTGEALGSAAVSGEHVFVGAPGSTLHVQDQGAVFVFAKPATGWAGPASEVAVLVASDASPGDRLGEWVAADGPDLVVGGGVGKVYVFAPPAGGWSGEAHQTAELSASDGAKLGSPVASGRTIVAQGTRSNAPGAVYVFTEPAGGWSGTLHETAKLSASDGMPGDQFGASVAASGTTIVAGAPLARVGSDDPGAVYVFTEPAAGWSGTLHERAKLTGSDISTYNAPLRTATSFGLSVAVSGSTVVAALPPGPRAGGAVYVFTEPSGGWASETQAAKLVAPGDLVMAGSPDAGSGFPNPYSGPMLTISGDTIVVPGSRGSTITHPAEFVFTKPARGWSGTQTESATLVASDGGALDSPVISGRDVIGGELAGPVDQTLVAKGAAYVFSEPSGGWSGTLTETAKLADQNLPPGGEDLYSEPATGWSSGPPSAHLMPSGTPGPVSFASVAVAGPTAVADQLGSAYVFTQPSGGSARDEPSATLTDSGAELGAVAISESTVAALAGSASSADYNPPQAHAIDMFTEPISGWSGTLGPAARLVPSDGALLVALAIDGPTVVAAGVRGSQYSVYVFTQPAGGWSGTIAETARLALPSSPYPQSISTNGAEVVVDGVLSGSTVASPDEALVFTEPAGGWQRTQPVSATLTAGSYDRAIKIYREPAGGWSGIVHPAARLQLSASDMYVGELSTSGNTIAAAGYIPAGKYETCPCGGGVWLFSRPAAGWSGTLTAPEFVPATTDVAGRTALALDRSVLFAGGQAIPMSQATDLDLFSVPSPVTEYPLPGGKPHVSSPSARGLGIGKPKLYFTLRAATNGAPIKSITITLPRGFSLAASKLPTSVLVDKHPVRTAHVRKHKLIIGLPVPRIGLLVTLRWPALVESKPLLRRIRRIQHARKQGPPVKLAFKTVINVTDAFQHQTRLLINIEFPVRKT